MRYKDMLIAVPGSYDDFVNSTARWMEKDEDICRAVLEQMRLKPDSERTIYVILPSEREQHTKQEGI